MKKTYQIEIDAPDVDTFVADRLVDALCANLREAMAIRSPRNGHRVGIKPADGLDRCACGSKYWAEYRCIDCGNTYAVVAAS